jgi:ribosomal protein S12 methylthiotransferase accessory factor YcaO
MLRALSMVGLASLAGPVTSRPAYVHPGFKVWETTENRDRRPLLAGNRGKGTRRQRKADKAIGENLERHAISKAICVGRKHYGRYPAIRRMILRDAMLTPLQRQEREEMRENEKAARKQVAATIHAKLMKLS